MQTDDRALSSSKVKPVADQYSVAIFSASKQSKVVH